MSGPVSFHLPVDASLHSFNSLDYGFSAKESSFVGSDATCGAGARAFSQYLNFEQPMRTSVSWVGTPGMLAVPAPSEAGVVRERDAPANRDRPLWEEQQLGVETRDAHGRTGVAEDVSTSQTFQEAFPPPNFGDMDAEHQADALLGKGPLRTLSARTFEALLDESNVKENEEWTALQNLPSLPRDMSAVNFEESLGMEGLAPSAPTPSRPVRAYPRDFDFETKGDGGVSGCEGVIAESSQLPSQRLAVDADGHTDYLDMDQASIDEVKRRAAAARALAEEARRVATKATATATSLTIRAKEMLDVASGSKPNRGGKTRNGGKFAKKPSTHKTPSSKTSSDSGVRTPTRSERGGLDAHADAHDVSSPVASASRSHKRERHTSSRPGLRNSDSTDMEDSDATYDAHGGVPDTRTGDKSRDSRAGKRNRVSAPASGPYAPKATDSILTADGQKIRRGCLNCGCQKTPQWRMGPTGPKTLCNACGVRFRKGMPMVE